jgi:glyoxylase-like metal-dependent hydrolase (beta-lactamase superfamily II)
MQHLDSGLITFPIPLPNNPLKALNGYLLTSEEGAVLIDTGFAMDACREAVYGVLDELNVRRDTLRVVLTHLHSDHTGLAGELADQGARLITGHVEAAWINRLTEPAFWEAYQSKVALLDLELDSIHYQEHPGYKYAPKKPMVFETVSEGDQIQLGAFTLKVLDLPGHTPGHIGLYCPERGCLFGGDHILDRITPNISYWNDDFESLGVYLNMLGKARALSLKRVYPSHRNIIDDPERRIDELIAHHAHRLSEIETIVAEGHLTVREVASHMHWDYRAKDWAAFPRPQKWFAASEAMAHLEHLCHLGILKRTLTNGKYYYSR